MSNFVQSTNFATKDALSSGDPLKIVKGTEINTEFNNIATAVATKADLVSPTFTGTPSLPTGTTAVTQSSGNNTTAIATTAFVQASAPASVIPSGTVMLFVQTAAPTGFTKSTTHDNKALRIVNGTVGTGGSVAFTTAFGTPTVSGTVSVSGTVGNHTLTTAQLASHLHSVTILDEFSTGSGSRNGFRFGASALQHSTQNTKNQGGNGAHNHSFSGSGSLSSATAAINVQFVDVIIATKD